MQVFTVGADALSTPQFDMRRQRSDARSTTAVHPKQQC